MQYAHLLNLINSEVFATALIGLVGPVAYGG